MTSYVSSDDGVRADQLTGGSGTSRSDRALGQRRPEALA